MVWEAEGEVTTCVAVQERTALVRALIFIGGSCSAIWVGHVVLPAAELQHYQTPASNRIAALLTCLIPDAARGSVLPHALLSDCCSSADELGILILIFCFTGAGSKEKGEKVRPPYQKAL